MEAFIREHLVWIFGIGVWGLIALGLLLLTVFPSLNNSKPSNEE